MGPCIEQDRVMRAALIASVLLAAPCVAQPVSQAPWMTGEKLLRLISYGSLPGFQSAEKELDFERARHYIDGVHDLSEGKAWCYSARHQPGREALQSDVTYWLKKVPPDQLQRNAADLIVEIWQRRWPCPSQEAQ
jgi:hypothetical protein